MTSEASSWVAETLKRQRKNLLHGSKGTEKKNHIVIFFFFFFFYNLRFGCGFGFGFGRIGTSGGVFGFGLGFGGMATLLIVRKGSDTTQSDAQNVISDD